MPVTQFGVRTNEYHVYICMCDIIQLRPKTSLASVITYIYFRVHLLMNRIPSYAIIKRVKKCAKLRYIIVHYSMFVWYTNLSSYKTVHNFGRCLFHYIYLFIFLTDSA